MTSYAQKALKMPLGRCYNRLLPPPAALLQPPHMPNELIRIRVSAGAAKRPIVFLDCVRSLVTKVRHWGAAAIVLCRKPWRAGAAPNALIARRDARALITSCLARAICKTQTRDASIVFARIPISANGGVHWANCWICVCLAARALSLLFWRAVSSAIELIVMKALVGQCVGWHAVKMLKMHFLFKSFNSRQV